MLGSLNTKDEGYFDGSTVFDWFHRKAREAGVKLDLNTPEGRDVFLKLAAEWLIGLMMGFLPPAQINLIGFFEDVPPDLEDAGLI